MKSIKATIIAVVLSVSANYSSAQIIVKDIDINELDISYIELVGYNKSLFGSKITIAIDYGQKFTLKSQLIKNAEGKDMIFNSMMHALNFMEDNGWEYVNNYALTMNATNVYHYLLRRKIKE